VSEIGTMSAPSRRCRHSRGETDRRRAAYPLPCRFSPRILTASTEQGEAAPCSPDRLKYSHAARPHASKRTAKGTAMNKRKMRIGMSIRGHGYHPAAWRHPDVPADGTLQVEHYVRSTQTAERGKLDMIFFADGAGIRQGDNPPGSLARIGRDMVELEPTMLLPALAMVTSHIGLVTTASTVAAPPYNLARRFATLDLISKG